MRIMYRPAGKKFAQLVLGTLVIEDIAGIFMMIIFFVNDLCQSERIGTGCVSGVRDSVY